MSQEQIRIDILLPLNYNDGTPLEEEKIYQTNLELSARFEGCTALMPVKGTWTDSSDGTRYEDMASGFYVIAPKTEETFEVLKEYKEILKQRFRQKEIMMTWYPLLLLSWYFPVFWL